jgi:DNA polymerase-4
MKRVVLHIDMNAFFASIEQRSNPFLRGRPVAVVGAGKRTVVTTASYEARSFGVRTGMNMREARVACPHLVIVRGDNRKYIDASKRMIGILKGFSPFVEPYSIDEAFVDLTGVGPAPRETALKVKEKIREALGITCSIGIGPNKLVAKLASDMQKPDGLVVIEEGDVKGVLERLPVEGLSGIGRRLASALDSMGIKTCGELSRYPASLLRQRFGITGERLKQMAQGIDRSPVSTEDAEPKSIGHSMTLPADVHDRGILKVYILRLSHMASERARREGVSGSRVSLTIRYPDFHTFGKIMALPYPTNDTHDVYRAACTVLGSIRLRCPVRLVGVCISSLARHKTLPLFPSDRKKADALEAIDGLNRRFGEDTVAWASLKDGHGDAGKGVIPPSWRPWGARSFDVR